MALIDKVEVPKQPQSIEYNKEEIEFLLRIIKDATFKGGELPLLVNLVNKLQQQYQSL
jgi:hypothetical protein